ncbi:MAG: type II toxin-antitoxin system VapC family toxin [Armatimonadota bacterium]
MILVDTSVWVEHLRYGSPRLAALLNADQVLCHPFVRGELACGHLQKRTEILGLLEALPGAPLAEHREAIHLLESARLHGLGLGWIDVHLLVSALLTRCGFWTLDKTLHQAAQSLKIEKCGPTSETPSHCRFQSARVGGCRA